MFTGLIREIGIVVGIRHTAHGLLYRVQTPTLHKELQPGGSVSVNGVCQSVTKLYSDGFEAIAGIATLEKTTFGDMKTGIGRNGKNRVHLEPALTVGERLDGHLVQGHVKGRIILERSYKKKGTQIFRFYCPEVFGVSVRPGDSVAIDGVSLTVSDYFSDTFSNSFWESEREGVGRNLFEVNLLPDTLGRTCFGSKRRGDSFNFEPDFLLQRNAEESRLTLSERKGRERDSEGTKRIENNDLTKWGYV